MVGEVGLDCWARSETFGLDLGIIAMNIINENPLHSKHYVFLPQFFISHDKTSWSKFSESSKFKKTSAFLSTQFFFFLEVVLSLLLFLLGTTWSICHHSWNTTQSMCVFYCLLPNRIWDSLQKYIRNAVIRRVKKVELGGRVVIR